MITLSWGMINMSENNKKTVKFLDRIVKGVVIYWIIFVIITWITFWVKDSIPDTLVQVGLGGGVLELVCTAAIEIVKRIFDKEEQSEEEDSPEDNIEEEDES